MRYRKLGSSDLEVSEVALGAWLTYSGGIEFDQTRACTEAAFEVGINFFDTANVYGRGAAETAWGEILSKRPRDSYILATKVWGQMSDDLDARREGYRLHLRLTGSDGRVAPADLDRLCPDWRERHTFASGPRELLDALVGHWDAEGDPGLLAMERFQPVIGEAVDPGQGGRIVFAKSGVEAESDGATPILVAGEAAGAELPFG